MAGERCDGERAVGRGRGRGEGGGGRGRGRTKKRLVMSFTQLGRVAENSSVCISDPLASCARNVVRTAPLDP